MKNPVEEKDKKKRAGLVFRGGNWVNYAQFLYPAIRFRSIASNRHRTLGFRIVRTKKNEDSSNR